MYIILVRHGPIEFNKKNIIQGQEVDPLINKLGKKQAEYTGSYLSKYFKFNKIYSSPLLRAKQTAEIIGKQLGYKKKISFDKNLQERKKGIFSGKKKDE